MVKTASEYLDKTESAARKLFEGIDSYIELLRGHQDAVFATSYTDEADFNAQFDAWSVENRDAVDRRNAAYGKFGEEILAQSILCGAVLQLASKGIQLFSKNETLPIAWSGIIRIGAAGVPFCIGREVRGVPLGLIVYAGRNQHAHYDDESLREPNTSVFERLALNHGFGGGKPFHDPAFDLRNTSIGSFASNITALIGWRSYEAYLKDMEEVLA